MIGKLPHVEPQILGTEYIIRGEKVELPIFSWLTIFDSWKLWTRAREAAWFTFCLIILSSEISVQNCFDHVEMIC